MKPYWKWLNTQNTTPNKYQCFSLLFKARLKLAFNLMNVNIICYKCFFNCIKVPSQVLHLNRGFLAVMAAEPLSNFLTWTFHSCHVMWLRFARGGLFGVKLGGWLVAVVACIGAECRDWLAERRPVCFLGS